MLTWISLTTVGFSHIVCQSYICILLSQNSKVGWVEGHQWEAPNGSSKKWWSYLWFQERPDRFVTIQYYLTGQAREMNGQLGSGKWKG